MAKLQLPSAQHFLHLIAYLTWVSVVIYKGITSRSLEDEDPFEKYGSFVAYFSIGVRLLAMLIIPQMAMMTIGLIMFDVRQPRSLELKRSVMDAPFVCVRVVTRGLYPTLVNQNVRSHLEVATKVGLANFVVEVVTDNQFDLDLTEHHQMKYVKLTVVPESYVSRNGTLNKARALQYCLEDGVNTLTDSDWIVHLDEETRLTTDSLKGVLNFVTGQDRHQFGQGVIVYGSQPQLPFESVWTSLQNRLCTVADSVRVADDLGKHKAQFKLLHRPYFGIKGSFVVSKFSAEKEVTWDFGPPGSKAEDAWMSLVAIDKGYTFDFVEGDMLERSPFTFADFFKQRRRWMQGIFMVAATPTIRPWTRLLIGSGLAVWLTLPLVTMGVVLQILFPFDLPYLWMDMVMGWVSATALYQYFIGYVRQFNVQRMSWVRLVLVLPEIMVASTVSLVAENLAVILMWFGDWYSFYIVQKEVQGMELLHDAADDENTKLLSTSDQTDVIGV